MIVARVRRTLRERGLLEAGGRVLCACSGGPDSAALLVALAQLQVELDFTLEAASVDHGLRADAGLDVEIARDQARSVGVPFHALRVQVSSEGSLQAAARSARYGALHGLAASISASRLALGHTRDDQAETVLMRVLRGAG
ncbi:MAG TPA: tRNA lysidine(34) synthetase TilS, partial [Polyangiales bacterium]|nr:tRNA lysidine(34) synthetase TilS [Polyangiales bacterium]